MSEKHCAKRLKKTVIKNELTRRIDWFETRLGFSSNVSPDNTANHHTLILYGRYRALAEMREQINNRLFIGGPAC